MPHLLCPGYAKCNRHYPSYIGLKGHVVTCKYAQQFKIKRYDNQPIGFNMIYILF